MLNRFSSLMIMIVALFAVACTSTYQVRDAETGELKASRSTRWTPMSTETVVACSKQRLLSGVGANGSGQYVEVDCSGYGAAYIPATVADLYWNVNTMGYMLPAGFPIGQYGQFTPAQYSAAANLPGSRVTPGGFLIDADYHVVADLHARTVPTPWGASRVERPKPKCWDNGPTGAVYWTYACGAPPPPHY